MRFVRSLFLDRIGGQIAVLILLSLIAIHAFFTASLYFSHRGANWSPPGEGPAQFAAAVKLIAVTPPDERAHSFAQIARAFPQLRVAQAPSMPVSHETGDRRIQFLSNTLGPSFQLAALPGGKDGTFNVAVKLPDGEAVTFALPPDDKPPMLGGPVALTLLFIVVSVTLLGLWATRALRNPLSGFARAAESFSLDDKVDALPERGPEEIRAVARAFNRMRARIKTLVADRIRLLAAMSHDLRTPITRLRLRSEFVADADLRDQMLRDLDQMKAMTDNVLSFLRDGQAREQRRGRHRLSLQTICDISR